MNFSFSEKTKVLSFFASKWSEIENESFSFPVKILALLVVTLSLQ